MIRRRHFRNQLLDLSEVDRSTLYLDSTQGYAKLFDFTREIALALGSKARDKVVFQCACGALAILTKTHLARLGERIRGAKDEALCPQCAGYEVSIRKARPETEIGLGLQALEGVLEQARTDNYASLCGFLFSPVMPERPRIAALRQSAAVIRDLIAKNKLDLLLSEQGIGPVPVDLAFAGRADLTLHLLSYHRLFVFAPLYDTLVSLLAIGTGELRMLDRRGETLQPVVTPIAQARPGETVDIERKIEETAAYCEEKGQAEIKAMIGAVFRPALNRAIVEAAYEVTEDSLLLTREGIEIPLAEVIDISLGLHLLVERVCEFLEQEQQNFAMSEGVEEGRFHMAAVADGDRMALKITSLPVKNTA